jgi:hypothetical protein
MWKVISAVVGIVVAGWLGWVSLTAMGATPQEKFDAHVLRSEDKFGQVQERIEDKLDALQQTILDLHKAD